MFKSKFNQSLIISLFISQIVAFIGTITGFVLTLAQVANSQLVLVSGVGIETIIMLVIISHQLGGFNNAIIFDDSKANNIIVFGVIINILVAFIVSIILMFFAVPSMQNVGLVGFIATSMFIFEFGIIEVQTLA